MPSLRAKVAAYRARSRFARAKSVAYKRNSARVYKTRISRPRRSMRLSGVHSFSRFATTSSTIVLANSESGKGGAYTYTLNSVSGYSEFTNLFDQYKIVKVDIMFKLHTNPYQIIVTQPSGTNYDQRGPLTFPTLYVVNDHDDSGTPTLAELRERQKTRRFVLQPNKIVKWSVRPAILGQLYRTATTTGYTPQWNKFIDCGNADVPHYGTKFFVDYDGNTLPAVTSGGAGQDVTINVEFRYHLVCKDVR